MENNINNSKYLLITNKDNNNNSVIDPKVLTLINDKSHLNLNNKCIYKIKNLIWNKHLDKHKSTSTKEWANSVYTYNKNYTKNLPVARNVINNLLTSYFNITNLVNGKKSNTSVILEKKYTLNKTLVSKAEVKFTNDKVNLTVYIYNRNKETIIRRLSETSNKNLTGFYNKNVLSNNALSLEKIINTNKSQNKINKSINNNLRKFTDKGIYFIKDIREFKDKLIGIVNQNIKLNSLSEKVISSNTNVNALLDKSFSNYEIKYFSDYLNTLYLQEMLSLYYIRQLLVNNNKFKNWFLLGLKKTISNLYNKKVELNIVNQKYFYLNSEIFIKALATRVKNRNNRIIHEINKALASISLARPLYYLDNYNINNGKRLGLIRNNLKLDIFVGVKYKYIQGIRVEAAGRLSQRLTASRSLSCVDSKGSLKTDVYVNRFYSFVRGNVKPNLQYTNLNSKTRNGAFGLKGWVSSN